MTRSLLIWIAGLAAFSALTWWCIAHQSPLIQADIKARAASALADADLAGTGLVSSADGLDVTLSGSVPAADVRRQAEQIVADVWGVRTVRNEILVVESRPAVSTTQTAFSAFYDGNQVILSGAVKDNTVRASIVGVARQAFTDKQVIDRLSINTSIPDTWSPVLKGSIRQLANFKTGKLDLQSSRLSLVGSVATLAVKEAATGEISRLAAAPLTTRFDISVLAPSQAIIADCQQEIDRLLAEKIIRFDTGSAIISIDSHPLLDAIAETINLCAGVSIEIQGHTDSAGETQANQQLSERRATAVLRYLEDDGVDTSRITARGYGEEKPVARNDTPDGRARNRRIDFVTVGN